ncbi:zeta toxin family protein [Candidatus Entotheonella palauensis]|uniref:Zeta toxin domain-containing protein n=1 Tax=Candidatus Entotheonella gemina TaxID=1429439 RepID=W4M7Y2_9BACT|nr:AAA family ATPase [Candidatus Entotheonella palauensis]ETX06469.1 MAG: hypothetical protein ETSY2_16925 [Candidatus Entotheonella gemina]
MPQLWVLVGGNGAGKSTYYEAYLKPMNLPFINADVLAKALFPNHPEAFSYRAARIADVLRQDMLDSRGSFCFETVYSHPSKVDFVADAVKKGYEVFFIMIGLDSESLHVGRVAQRVEQGGHSVPEDRVRSRIARTKKHVLQSIPLVHHMWIVDNSSLDAPFERQLEFDKGVLTFRADILKDWVRDVFAVYLADEPTA